MHRKCYKLINNASQLLVVVRKIKLDDSARAQEENKA